MVFREILVSSIAFKKFWKEKGPFRYALTSNEFPPVLLEPEEWIFSDDLTQVLKSLMGFDHKKMKVVKAPFNPKSNKILRPEALSPWKIIPFPEEWNACVSDLFVPEGHLTQAVISALVSDGITPDSVSVEQAFFHGLEGEIEKMGYCLLKPQGASASAMIQEYLQEWEEDEADAGLL